MQFVVDITGPVRVVFTIETHNMHSTEVQDQIASYADHNIFELYAVLLKNKIKVDVPQMHKEALVALVHKHNITVPEATYNLPKWDLELGRYNEFSITIIDPKFSIMEDDTFTGTDGKKYIVDSIHFVDDDVSVYYENDFDSDIVRDACRVSIMNMDTDEVTTLTGWEFIRTIASFDIKFTKSRWLRYVNKY